MTTYTLLLFVPEDDWVGKAIQRDELQARHAAFVREVAATGAKILNGVELTGTEAATTIRKRTDADDTITDGPFAETKEQLGGYYVVEATDLDQVIRLAKLLPEPAIEIRPVVQGG
ncbi:YciI family protein [Fodinicola acaciae]|uniref:YciI family protein n=1 Tax=Fodinicola acaciae TaxID=2681555 RepID=UPI0013D459A7|nr:YciI family protein [Fodinicola acaciae]